MQVQILLVLYLIFHLKTFKIHQLSLLPYILSHTTIAASVGSFLRSKNFKNHYRIIQIIKQIPIRNKLKTPAGRFRLISYWANTNVMTSLYILKKTSRWKANTNNKRLYNWSYNILFQDTHECLHISRDVVVLFHFF